jgi:hypothetical protein
MRPLVLLLAALFVFEAPAQLRSIQQRKMKKDSIIDRSVAAPSVRQVDVRKLFGQIEHGILNSSLASSPVPFAQQVYINVPGGESGYFSSNQGASILQTYFSGRVPISFQFTRYSDKAPNPYATGRLTFARRGQRESAQIYVSFVFQDSRWVIGQFNIY